MKIRSLFLLLIFAACQSQRVTVDTAGTTAPVLFTIGDSAVMADEFNYVYRKNNSQLDSAFTAADVENYLGLYENFKLKIMEAYSRGYDTLEEYKKELDTYVRQLKEPYLTETRITDELIKEAFDRTREEVRASHILIRFPENPAPSDTLEAYEKISRVRKLAVDGLSFDSLAAAYSEDPSVRNNRGDLGYFTSMQMVYPFENAAYQTPEGQISPIIRTRFGYHILRVDDRRPAHGQVVVAHIMLRHSSDSASVRNRIFEIHEMAEGGMDWEQLVREYSEDVNSKERGGIINPFGVGQAPFSFQEAAFALENRYDISDPVESPYGWHIIRLEEKRGLPSRETLEPSIKRRISQDERARLGKEYLIERLKEEWGFTEAPDVRQLIEGLTDSTSNSVQAQGQETADKLELFSIGSKRIYAEDFMESLRKWPATSADPENSVWEKYMNFRDSSIVAWEESNLAKKYPDYRMLLREYREGILYFKIMEEEVWNPASEDSVGLREYYELNAERYRGGTTASATVYPLPDSLSAVQLEQLLHSGDNITEWLESLNQAGNTPVLPVEVEWSEGDNSPWSAIPMKEGSYRENIMKKWYVIDVVKVEENKLRPLSSIRGLVISDYQQYLEEKWLQQLKVKYPVRRNERGVSYVFEALVK